MSKNQLTNYDIHDIFKITDEEILQPEDIANLINMHVESVRRWCRQGKLPSYNFGNKYIIVGEDFKNFMKRAKVIPSWER
ncbi:helix-turn-helix domain-containing protein [Ornithinibacillus californiensis]|uniref:helix-turn-helix domain-containing protein n=1 Tax=Ornithinibacillus californiensis TaxID=161536 RepID=UPI00064DCBEF|nr:helix-turn-helix domain-containing protein [Ornithinibacillus californiensis]